MNSPNQLAAANPKSAEVLLRSACLLLLSLIFACAHAQGSGTVWDEAFRYAMESSDIASGKSVFQVVKPDIVVQVTKHRFGADMFELSAVNPSYPPDLLARQANEIGALVGVPSRGVTAFRVNVGGSMYARATFATDGIIDRDKGILRVSPIIRAFAGAPEPYTVHGITILFNGEQPSANVLRSYGTPDIRLQAVSNQNPPVVEYRIQLLSQDPTLLDVPDASAPEQKQLPSASTEQRNGVDWSLWIPLLVAAVAAGILVYFLMLRLGSRPRR